MDIGQKNPDGRNDVWKYYRKLEEEITFVIRKFIVKQWKLRKKKNH